MLERVDEFRRIPLAMPGWALRWQALARRLPSTLRLAHTRGERSVLGRPMSARLSNDINDLDG